MPPPPRFPLQRTSSEVQTLASRSEMLLLADNPAPKPQVKEMVWSLKTLFGDFEARLEARGKSLTSATEFYEGAQLVREQ